MDRDQFDRLSRLVGATETRRGALRTLVIGAMAGVMTAAATEGEESAAARKRRQRRERNVRGELQQPVCPATCNQNCDNKPLRGGVNLTKCNFNVRDLDGVKLNGSNLTNACFGDSSLRNADLRATNASGACFCGADLAGANLRGSNITAAQLACASVACNTILPNGKPAVACSPGRTCCNSVCTLTGSDPNNCGACGTRCGACQFCNFGQCENLADAEFDCTRAPLEQLGGGTVCTAGPFTGICDQGQCNCGPRGEYIPDANVCICNPATRRICELRSECCELTSTCLEAGSYSNSTRCLGCSPP